MQPLTDRIPLHHGCASSASGQQNLLIADTDLVTSNSYRRSGADQSPVINMPPVHAGLESSLHIAVPNRNHFFFGLNSPVEKGDQSFSFICLLISILDFGR